MAWAPAILRECAQELGRGLLYGLPLTAAVPLLAVLDNIGLMRLTANRKWRSYPYNWQLVAGFIVTIVCVCGTVFLHALTDQARQAEGADCTGLYGWLTAAFVADIVMCVPTAALGLWYSIRMYRWPD